MRIELGRYSDILRRLLNLGGKQIVADELAPELSAVLVLEDDRPEWLFPSQYFTATGLPVTIGAGLSAVRFRNPPGSGVLMVCEAVLVRVGVAETVSFRVHSGAANLGTVSDDKVLDLRFGAAQLSPLVVSSSNAAAAIGSGVYSLELAAATPTVFPPAPVKMPLCIMGPDTGFDIICTTVGIALRAIAWFRMRPQGRYER